MKPVNEWEEKDLDDLYHGQIMESLTLDYKDSGSLGNTSDQRNELFKDVSAFANSAGGTIIYGMKEVGHLPQGTDVGVDPSKLTREWLENVLTSNVQPKIEGLLVKPVILKSKGQGNVAYVLDIPQATSRGPHQGPGNRYYKRYNFKSEPMQDYEVRDLMRRGLEYGRKYGAAFDLYIELSRLGAAADARAKISRNVFPSLEQVRISVSPDLRSAGSILVLMSRKIRNGVGELLIGVDNYNAQAETLNPGGEKVALNEQLQSELSRLSALANEICGGLSKIMDAEP